jgi:hypothetical protein
MTASRYKIEAKREQGQPWLSLFLSRSVPTSLKKLNFPRYS